MQSPLPDVLSDIVFNELNERKCVVLSNALPSELWERYFALAQRFDQQGLFRPAHIMGDATNTYLPNIRGDRIMWLDSSLGNADVTHIFEFLETLRKSLNQNLFAGLTHFECHFTCYEPGKGYDTHVDQRQNAAGADSERVISFVLYLNSDWKNRDGGHLELHLPSERIVVEPQGGTLVLFDSRDVPHRVLASVGRDRWSLTGWFRRWSNLNHAPRR